MSLAVGILGSAVLMAGWAYETFQSIRTHKELIDLKFAAIYLVSLVILTYYSYLIQSVVFIWLNFMLLGIVGVEAGYTLYLHKTKRK